jgi:hypothetical protein
MSITLDKAVYEGLYVLNTSLEDGYRAMAADKAREAEAMEWCNAIAGDMADAAR